MNETPLLRARHLLSSQEVSLFLLGRHSVECLNPPLLSDGKGSLLDLEKLVSENTKKKSVRSREWAGQGSMQSAGNDAVTSDLQNRTFDFSVLLFPYLKLGVIIQASDTNWVSSP